MPDTARTTLRQTLRQARRALSPAAQTQAAERVAAQLTSLDEVMQADTLAWYLPNDGEVSLMPFARQLTETQPALRQALPVLHPFCKGHLLFLHYHGDTLMQTNRFGIREPALDCTAVIPPAQLTAILMPLVGFDSEGNRLGMGGGFYDRTLAHRHSWSAQPRLIGVAHDCQQVAALPTASWDVPLDAIVTPSQIIRPTTASV